MDAVLLGGPEIAQRHAGAEQFATVAQLARWNPALGKRTVVQQDSEALASRASVLLVLPIRFLASVGLARCGRCPAFSISSTIQYQWPVAWCSTRTAGEVFPLPSMVTKTENCLWASHPIFAGIVFSYGA